MDFIHLIKKDISKLTMETKKTKTLNIYLVKLPRFCDLGIISSST